jgi:dephospho-CoA kinase
MKQNGKTGDLLAAHCLKYPKLQIRDVFKYLYQSAFGCEHLVSSIDDATDRIRQEYTANTSCDRDPIEALDGEYSRLDLCCLSHGLSTHTLASLFCKSSKTEADGKESLENKLAIARQLVDEGALPFSIDEFEKEVTEWRSLGYPPVHHSDIFRQSYHPSYRVISNRYLPFLPLFAEIDKRLAQGPLTVAIEGGSASGKTTLSELLGSVYDCTVFHMDDFFLRPEQRTEQRYAEVGGNVDRERFSEEVLTPLKKGETISYRRFDCATMTLAPAIKVVPKKLIVIEGAYCMHPELADFYDLSVFLDIPSDLQRKRIEKRNSPQMATRFFEEWIPLEAIYFSQMKVKERCDLSVKISE